MTSFRDTERISVTAGFAGAGALAYYALARAIQHLMGNEPNPATVIWSLHAGFFWREVSALFVAGFIALATWLLSKDELPRLERALPKVLAAASFLMIAQAIFIP